MSETPFFWAFKEAQCLTPPSSGPWQVLSGKVSGEAAAKYVFENFGLISATDESAE